MPRTFTAADRSALIRLASSLPAGSAERADILFIVEHARPVRVASSGRVVYAFSFSSLKSDFWSFVQNLADKVMDFADMLKKVELTPEAEREINQACAAAVKALDKVGSSKQASHRKDANLLGVAAMGAALGKTVDSANRGNPRDEAVALYMVGLAFFPLVAAFGVFMTVATSYAYYKMGEESDVHVALRKKAKEMLDYAKGKSGFVQKMVRFLSKFLHSDPTPDPFGDMGAVFELYGLWYQVEPDKAWEYDVISVAAKKHGFLFAHPFGKVSFQEADKLAHSGSFYKAIEAISKEVRSARSYQDSAGMYVENLATRNAVIFLMKNSKEGTWWGRGHGDWFLYPTSKAKDLVKQVRKVPNL
jgi:hypothetical protein